MGKKLSKASFEFFATMSLSLFAIAFTLDDLIIGGKSVTHYPLIVWLFIGLGLLVAGVAIFNGIKMFSSSVTDDKKARIDEIKEAIYQVKKEKDVEMLNKTIREELHKIRHNDV
jgi:uncharacterized membrane protein (DUF106 family)